MKCPSEETVLFVCISILIALFAGEPDLSDAIIYKLTDGQLETRSSEQEVQKEESDAKNLPVE